MTEKSDGNRHYLKGKAAIVTGGTRGIGRAIVSRLLEEGVRVALCGTRRETVEKAVAELSVSAAGAQGPADAAPGTTGTHPSSRDSAAIACASSSRDVWGAVADVSRRDQVSRLVAEANERFGGIDILVNNAGAGTFRSVADLEPEEFDRMIALNLSGVFYCCHDVMPIFRERGGGDIINISSLAGKNPFAGGSGYNASKFGLNGFSEAMMLDHRAEGVRVSYIMPGSVATEFGGHEADEGSGWKIAPEDIADVVAMLLLMPRRTTVSRVEIRPSRPPRK